MSEPMEIAGAPADVDPVKLCSEPEIADLFGWVVCDLRAGHRGPHRATLLWGDDADEEQP